MHSILLIDDDDTILRLLESALSDLYTVHVAANGRTGLTLAREVLPGLVLCDIGLPDMDGYDVVTQLRSSPSTTLIPVVFLTAATDRESMRRAMALGAEDFLTKPFTITELREAVRTQFAKQDARERRFEAVLAELRDNISTSLPHEIRTSIMVVQGYTELLMADHPPDSTAHEMLATIHQHTARMSRLAEKFLWYVRSNWPLSPREAALVERFPDDLLRNLALDVAARSERERDLHLDAHSGCVKAPTEHLERLFSELLDNAFKFSQAGTPVSISATCEDAWYHVSICDEGRGMSMEQIASMGAFMQFERQQYEQQGTGLGLMIAYQIVKALNGEFKLNSPGTGSGTCVDLWLPRIVENTAPTT